MRRLTIALAVWLVALPVLAGPATAAQDALKPFYGTWAGSALAKNRDSKYFGVGTRAAAITIAPEGDGFVITWTTIKSGNAGKAKSATLHFRPAARKGVYKAEASGEPADGKPYMWASVVGKTMTLYILAVNDKGGYDLSIYARTITENGMTVRFRRLRDGEPIRIVSGTLHRRK